MAKGACNPMLVEQKQIALASLSSQNSTAVQWGHLTSSLGPLLVHAGTHMYIYIHTALTNTRFKILKYCALNTHSHNGVLFSYKDEQNYIISRKIDGTEDYVK